MSPSSFFEERSDQSQVKAEIVEKYFLTWARIIKQTVLRGTGRIAYVDLFAGPGRYEDGAASVPILILQEAIKDEFLRDHLVTLFNDKNDDHTQTLETEIKNISGIDALKYPPDVMNEDVGDNIVQMFEEMDLIPTLFFVDPWGYKGLSLGLVNSVLKNWGCDCIFFFNYNRINPGLSNPMVKEHMVALFGEDRAEELRAILAPMSPRSRELTIVEAISEALKEMGGSYVLPFTFKKEDGSRTSHHLIFVSKHIRGYEVMKDIMARASSEHDEGVASFAYSRADASTPLLFEFARPLSELGQMLLQDFAGCTLSMNDIYEAHHVDRPFIKKNYKDALVRLEADEKIEASPPAEDRQKRKGQPTFADHVVVSFPEEGT